VARASIAEILATAASELTFHAVSWNTKPFEMPPYYGARVTHWLDRSPEWGLAFDFTHAKMYSELNDQVYVTGRRSGSPVNGSERLGDTFSTLEFTDGNNLFTLNAMHRWHPFRNDRFSRFRDTSLYAGAGVAMPHVEVVAASTRTIEFQFAGPVAQGMLGVSIPINKRFVFLTEYRLTYADIDAGWWRQRQRQPVN
jgi:lipid A oxidase